MPSNKLRLKSIIFKYNNIHTQLGLQAFYTTQIGQIIIRRNIIGLITTEGDDKNYLIYNIHTE